MELPIYVLLMVIYSWTAHPTGIRSSSSPMPSPSPSNLPAPLGELLLRCYNDTFDTLMCLPGTVVSITRIRVEASTTVCRLSQGHCGVEWPADREFSARARTACDGRLTCDDLRADVDKVQCDGASNYVDVSFISIEYTCMNSTVNADFRHAIRCSGKNFTSSFCLGAGTIEVANVYIGVTDTSSCRATAGNMGSVLRRLDNSSDVVFAYRQQCDGQTACVNTTTVGLAHEFSLLEYRCTGTSNHSTAETHRTNKPTTTADPSTSETPSTDDPAITPVSSSNSVPSLEDQTSDTTLGTSSDGRDVSGPQSNVLAISVSVPILTVAVAAVAVTAWAIRRRTKKRSDSNTREQDVHIYANQGVSHSDGASQVDNADTSAPYADADVNIADITPRDQSPDNSPRLRLTGCDSANYEEVHRVTQNAPSQYALSPVSRDDDEPNSRSYENATPWIHNQNEADIGEYLSLHRTPGDFITPSVYSELR